jgi:hypothetical protein
MIFVGGLLLGAGICATLGAIIGAMFGHTEDGAYAGLAIALLLLVFQHV